MSEPALSSIFLEFVRLGLLSFGGTNLAEMERVLVRERGWISAQTFANGFALGQLLPGPNLLAVLHYGAAMAGWGGAAAALLGFFGPTAGLGTALALGWGRLRDGRWSEVVRAALIPFGAGVALAGLLVLARISVQSWVGAVIALVSFGLLQRTRLNAAVVVLAAAGLGAWLGL